LSGPSQDSFLHGFRGLTPHITAGIEQPHGRRYTHRVGTEPRVSIIIPLFNLGAFVAEAIDSALGQTLPPEAFEVIVIDDGSTDGGGEVARGYGSRIRYVRQENRGVSSARNSGIATAHGQFLTFLDADDRMLPEKLAAQLDAFATRPEAGVVYCGCYYIDEQGARLPQHGWSRQEGSVYRDLVLGNLVHPHQPLVRRGVIEATGSFDDALSPAADWDYWLRTSEPPTGCSWACVDRPLAEYRVRRVGMHQNVDGMLQDCRAVLDSVFARPPGIDLGTDIRAQAYQNIYLAAACAHLRAGDRRAGARCVRAAIDFRSEALADPKTLRRFCRLVLPLGYRYDGAIVANWRPLTAILRTALADLYSHPDLDADIRRQRWRSTWAYWQTVARLARKNAVARARHKEPAVRVPLGTAR
jgi:glycosyltransferase involved in cell wall biosynthesis